MPTPVKLPKPTDGELAILAALWEIGPATVRQIHHHLDRDTAYTTVLKLLQIMTDKGLVRRIDSPPPARSHIYAAAQPAQATQRRLLSDLVDKAFAGSAANLVLQALAAKRASPDELAQIKKLLDDFQQGEAQ